MNNKISFGENLKTLRIGKGFTQQELASRLMISRQSISKWEKDISLPSIIFLTAIREILKCTFEELLQTYIQEQV